MGYEVPYYVIFGLAHFTKGRWRWPLVALALLLAGPAIVISFPLWLLGVVVYRSSCRHPISPRAGLWLFAGSLAAWLSYELVAQHSGRLLVDVNAWFKRVQVLQDYVVGTCFAVNLLGFQAAVHLLGRPLLPLARLIRWLAGATFALYLTHEPIAQFLVATSPWAVSDGRTRAAVLLGTLTLVFLLAAITERRKQDWRRLFERCWPAARLATNPNPSPNPP
jgi:peptidoglycan/LPS O-acetylase OafA/YrhL